MEIERTLFRIFGNGSIRQYPLSVNEWRELIFKNPIKGWQTDHWFGVVITTVGERTWIDFVSCTGHKSGPRLPELEKVLQLFKDQQEAI